MVYKDKEENIGYYLKKDIDDFDIPLKTKIKKEKENNDLENISLRDYVPLRVLLFVIPCP